MDLREREVMNQICSSIVRMDWHIKFVCILDHNGRLLVGYGRNIPSINTNDSYENIISSAYNFANITNSNSKIDELVEIFLKHKNMYLFYSDYLLWIIENCGLHLNDGHNENNSDLAHGIVENKTSTYFEIPGYDNDDDVKLAITPLCDSKFRFFCIYFEPAYRLRNSFIYAKVFQNLLNNISTDLRVLETQC
jgi:hypothetical protein